MQKKSMSTNVLLTVLFGPLGLLYASAWQGAVLTIVALYLSGAMMFTGLLILWVLSLVLGVSAVRARNYAIDKREALEERRHQEIVAATKAVAGR